MNAISYVYEIEEEDLSVNAGFDAAKQMVIDKIFSTIKRIEDKFNVNIPFIFKNENPIVFDNVEPFELFVDKNYSNGSLSYIATSNKKHIGFSVDNYNFSLKNSSKFTVEFDSNLNFSKLMILSSKANPSRTYLSFLALTFDSDLNFNGIQHIDKEHGYHLTKDTETLSPYDDELLLFKIYKTNNESLINDFPEFYIPSAYDFNSVEFADRLTVYSMLIL